MQNGGEKNLLHSGVHSGVHLYNHGGVKPHAIEREVPLLGRGIGRNHRAVALEELDDVRLHRKEGERAGRQRQSRRCQ